MKKRRVKAYLVSRRVDHAYLAGFTGEDSAVMITPREVHVISDGRFDEAISRECPWARKWLRKALLNDEIVKVCKELKIRSLAVQHDHMTLADHATLRKLNKGTWLVAAPPIVTNMRRIKSTSELPRMAKALRIAEEAFLALRETIRLGETELDLAARLEYEMKRRGASEPAFPTIIAEGPNGALPHAVPGNRKIKSGSAILFDWGARVDGYCSDLTRMLFVDGIPPKFAEIYGVVLESQERAIAGLCPGKRMCDVDAIARDFVTEAGYGKEFNHGLGHGLGMEVHEAPALSWRSKEKLEAGMLVTVEPGIYISGLGGVRIEDDVFVTPTGCRVLSRLSTRLEDALIHPAR
jgi:Xaa-Pro aminopeptidase